jgi:uncharacterized membrane protein
MWGPVDPKWKPLANIVVVVVFCAAIICREEWTRFISQLRHFARISTALAALCALETG